MKVTKYKVGKVSLYRIIPANKQRRNYGIRTSLFATPNEIVSVVKDATIMKRETPGTTYLLMKVYLTIYEVVLLFIYFRDRDRKRQRKRKRIWM